MTGYFFNIFHTIKFCREGGREIITRYITNLDNQDEFYTDSNGREMLIRKKNYRPTYEYSDEEPQSGNYYPVNTRIVIKNNTNEFAVLTDRSEGGSSLNSGQIELMVSFSLNHSLKKVFRNETSLFIFELILR